MLSPYDPTHDWMKVMRHDHVEVSTCLRCGLLRLQTLNNVFYYTELAGDALKCPRPFHGPLDNKQNAL
jgi:hypothetical protein